MMNSHSFPVLSSFRTAALLIGFASAANAQTLVRSLPGPAANAQYGKACIRIPDQNGDGFADLLIGAPGFNSQRGAIYCVSGAYLALGAGTQTLWSIAPTGNQGDLFGYALAEIPDATADGVKDFLVGRPGYDISGFNDVGSVHVVDGVTHAIVSQKHGVIQGGAVGSALAVMSPDQVLIAAPSPLLQSSRVHRVSASQLSSSGQLTGPSYAVNGSYELGTSVAPGADLDGDGQDDFVAGAPGYSSSAGAVFVYLSSVTNTALYASPNPGERLGSSIDAAHDYDGDGVVDIVVGAPKWLDGNGQEAGRVVVISGARLAAQTPPYEIYTFTSTASSLVFDYHFGTAVRASGDLNNDGIGEILVGAPNYSTGIASGFNRGFVSIFSGATGAKFASIVGSHNEYLGDSLTGAIGDLEGDGIKEFVFAGSLADSNGADSGVVKFYRLFPLQPATYCVGKPNSLGCTPAMGFSGSPKVNSPIPFLVTASNVLNQKSGLLFYSHAPLNFVFQGGLKCVAGPSVRTPQQNSGGSTSGADCSGTHSFNFNAWISGSVDPTLVVGAEVFAQYWSRDPQSPSTTSLSNGLRFVINP